MSNSLTSISTFLFETHNVRIVIGSDGEPAFVAKDIAVALGYSNISDAISKHCRGVAIRYPIMTPGGMQEARVIKEPDVYRMVARSKLPKAVEFERMIFEEILPSIRKTGKWRARDKRDHSPISKPIAQSGFFIKTEHVYIIDFGDIIKIGRSSQPLARIAAVKTSAGRGVRNKWISPPLKRSGEMERLLHVMLDEDRSLGEFFYTLFDDAVALAESHLEGKEETEESLKEKEEKLAQRQEGLFTALERFFPSQSTTKKAENNPGISDFMPEELSVFQWLINTEGEIKSMKSASDLDVIARMYCDDKGIPVPLSLDGSMVNEYPAWVLNKLFARA